MGKSEVEAARASGVLHKHSESLVVVCAHFHGRTNKLTARYTRTKRSRERSLIASSGEAANNNIAENVAIGRQDGRHAA
eukprot:6201131-Pleurochrysis_carterae.AAC.2